MKQNVKSEILNKIKNLQALEIWLILYDLKLAEQSIIEHYKRKSKPTPIEEINEIETQKQYIIQKHNPKLLNTTYYDNWNMEQQYIWHNLTPEEQQEKQNKVYSSLTSYCKN